MSNKRATIIGHAIIDVVAGPVPQNFFEASSIPMQDIKMTFGGNGYNEASALRRLGVDVNLISKLGNDEAGKKVLHQIEELGIDAKHIKLQDDLVTSINVVLFDENGERRFLTNPQGSQRKMSENEVLQAVDDMADVVCFSCMFVSPLYDIESMQRVFAKIKEKPGRILVVDMTKPKNGETIEDIKCLLPYIDYFLPNEEEIKMLGNREDGTSKDQISKAAKKLLDCGVGHIVVKRGGKGCDVYTNSDEFNVAAYRIDKVVDTTGAGDSFVAGFIYGLLNDMPLMDCARFGNATASCSVECVGATDGIVDANKPTIRFNELKNI